MILCYLKAVTLSINKEEANIKIISEPAINNVGGNKTLIYGGIILNLAGVMQRYAPQFDLGNREKQLLKIAFMKERNSILKT